MTAERTSRASEPPGPPEPAPPEPPESAPGPSPVKIGGRVAMLAITGVSLYLLAPTLIDVFSSTSRLDELEPWWLAVMVLLQAGSFACMWWVQKLSMQVKGWFAVATSQLAGNAFGRVVPGGAATAGALQYKMLVDAGVPGARVASGLTASSLLTFAMLMALPVGAVPGILAGTPVSDGLLQALWIGLALFVLIFAVGAVLLVFDGPLIALGRLIEGIRRRVRRHRQPSGGLPARLVRERNLIRTTLGRQWWEALLGTVGKWGLDYLTLLAALTAVGASPSPSLTLLAYSLSQILGQIPLTPGGLGFVEAGLTGTLALAGISPADALLATLAYRLVSYWLPLPAGVVAVVLHRRRYGRSSAEPAAAEQA